MKLLLVDDDELILKSLSIMLDREADIQVLGTANNGVQAIEACARLQPDVVLMDIRMPKMDGIAATRRIKEDFPDVRIMMLTTFDDRPNIEEALAAGADGYLLKTDEVSTIADKLRPLIAAAGVSVLDAEVLKTLSASERSNLDELTQREKDITRLVAQGLSNKEIAAQLFLSEGTVRNNIANIMEKLHLKNRTQLGMAYYGK
jgi:DNA-binding NarL/FixJ family response regulator